jgi:hypothetical protein
VKKQKPTPTLHIYNQRMVELVDILKNIGIIRFRVELLRAIDMKNNNWHKIMKAEISFTSAQLHAVMKEYNVNPAWLFGFDDKVFRKK